MYKAGLMVAAAFSPSETMQTLYDIRFEVMGVQYVSLVECKHYKNPITREKVQALHSPSSVCIYVLLPGCITMILFSTKNFC